jgi:hypothetical protein
MQNDKMQQDLNEIKIAIAEIKQILKFRENNCAVEIRRITKLEELLLGNGQPGIKTQVYILWGAFIALSGLLLYKI